MFNKAQRQQTYMKIALVGVSGCGKTYSALLLAQGLGGKIAMIDTENGSGSLYSDICDYDICIIEPPFTVDKYINAIDEAEKAGYGVLIIDSLSHAWAAEGGLLDQVDKKAAMSKSGNSYTAWRDVTPQHNKLVSSILQSKLDVIVTMRAKTAYEIETNEKGKKVPVKRGLAPIQRDGLEYEFTIVFDIDKEKHYAEAGKDRTNIFDGLIEAISVKTGQKIRNWVNGGAAAIPAKAPDPAPAEPPKTDKKTKGQKPQEDPPKDPPAEPAQKKIFVEINDTTCLVLTSKGMINVKDIAVADLVKLMNRPQYEAAWPFIDEVLNEVEEQQTAENA